MAKHHPIWGSLINDYAAFYTLDSFLREPLTAIHPATRLWLMPSEPLAFIGEICEIGAETDEDRFKILAEGITLSKLRTIVGITSTAPALKLLHGPLLVQGCIRLMQVMDELEKQSIFKYEYGYLCFRIMTIALGLCQLTKSMELTEPAELPKSVECTIDGLISIFVESPEVHPLTTFAKTVAAFVHHDFNSAWKTTAADRAARLITLIPTQEAILLLNLLRTNRKAWFQALSTTYTPGISGVMLMLWQAWRLAWLGLNLIPQAPIPMTYANTCNWTVELFILIEKHIPREILEDQFDDFLDDWAKYYEYLEWDRKMMSTSGEYYEIARYAQGVWKGLLDRIGQVDKFENGLKFVPATCAYARYCSCSCQIGDWVRGSELGSHSSCCEGPLGIQEGAGRNLSARQPGSRGLNVLMKTSR